MRLSTRLIALLAALALGLAASACGGGDDESQTPDVPAEAIAVVGDREIPKSEYDRLLKQAEATYKARQQEFPEAGTPEFAQLRNAIVTSLVEQAQFEIAAEELG
ncbi:MAG: SurA N-terminal domain-containing protein, partial [Gaiellaceae bacterium]